LGSLMEKGCEGPCTQHIILSRELGYAREKYREAS